MSTTVVTQRSIDLDWVSLSPSSKLSRYHFDLDAPEQIFDLRESGSIIQVFRNGVLQAVGNDYTHAGRIVIFIPQIRKDDRISIEEMVISA